MRTVGTGRRCHSSWWASQTASAGDVRHRERRPRCGNPQGLVLQSAATTSASTIPRSVSTGVSRTQQRGQVPAQPEIEDLVERPLVASQPDGAGDDIYHGVGQERLEPARLRPEPVQGTESEGGHPGVQEGVRQGDVERAASFQRWWCPTRRSRARTPSETGVQASRRSAMPVLLRDAFGEVVATGELGADPGRDAPPSRLVGVDAPLAPASPDAAVGLIVPPEPVKP